ncbi:MAG: hypothetical protein GXP55_03720 [Deltaproteobacteria bacterium]|nr:hypothetical protein [Deltaproteobacteria bacterium]
MTRGAKRVGSALGWTLCFALAWTASLLVHLPTLRGRRVAARGLSTYISSQMAGRLVIGRIDELTSERVVLRHLALFDPAGRRVLTGDEAVVVPELSAAWAGTLRFRDVRLRAGTLRLVEGADGLPTFLAAFAPREPPSRDAGPGLHALVDHIGLSGWTVYGQVLGVRGVRLERLSASGRLEILGDVRIRVDQARGELVAPYPRRFELERVVARIRGDPALGTRLYAQLAAPDERVELNLHYAMDPDANPGGQPPPMRLDLLLHADPVHVSTLQDVGLSFASALSGDLRGYLRLRGRPDDLSLRAWLETAGGPIAASGQLPAGAPFEVRLRAPGLDLAPIIPGAPALHITGELSLRAGEAPGAATAVQLSVEAFHAFGLALPGFELTGRIAEDGLHVDGAHANTSGGVLDASGHVGFDGALDLRVRARLPQVARDPSLRALMPGARGGLRADVRLRGDADRLHASGRVRMAPFVWGPLRADYVELSGALRGVPERPRGRARLRAGGVSLAGYPIGDGGGELTGGPRRWHTQAHFTARGRRQLSFDANLLVGQHELHVDAPSFRVGRGDAVYQGSVDGLVYRPGRGVSATRVSLSRGAQHLELMGEWRAHGADSLEAHAQALDVRSLRALLPFPTPDAAGRLSGALQITGDLETSPVIHFSGDLAEGRIAALGQVTGRARLDYAAGDLQSHGSVVIGGGGALVFHGTGTLEDVGLGALGSTLREGLYEARLSGDDLDLTGFAPLWPGALSELQGHVDLELQFSGMLDVPTFHGHITSEDLRPEGWPSLGAEATFHYQQGVLDTRAILSDRDGELAETEVNFLADLASLLAEPQLAGELLAVAPWRISLRVPPRLVARLPAPLREPLGEALDPLMFSLSATFSGGSQPVRGDLTGNLRWMGDFSDLPCGSSSSPRALFEATIANGQTRAQVRIFSGATRLMELSGSAPTPVDEWLAADQRPELPPLELEARMPDAPLAELPYVCEHLGGRASVTLRASDVLGQRPEAHLSLDSTALTFRRFEQVSARRRQAGLSEETPPVSLTVRADLSQGTLSFDGSGDFWNGGGAHASGTLATPWEAGALHPTASGDGLDLEAELAGAPLAALLTFMPGIERVSGLLDGRVTATGSLSAPQLGGEIELSEGSLDIVGVGQRLERARGDFLLAGDRVLMRDVSVSDGEGQANLSGELRLAGLTPDKLSLRLTADAFPVRQEGSVLATLDGHASLEADLLPASMQGELVVRDLSVRLSETSSRSTQALAPHPDITVVGERFMRAGSESSYPISLDVRAPEPLWVRGQDFSARVTANLGVRYANSFRVSGEMGIDRGFFEVFGKRFEVRQGAMSFDGGAELDPLVQLVAVHTLRDRGGDTVTVSASGRLSRPVINFRTSVNGCSDESQIIALLVSGSCQLLDRANQTATAGGTQAAEFLQGLAFGVLTLSLREELGQYFPVIVVESGQRGIGGTRIRAGFDARDLLPEAVRRVITGAYVEGSVDIAGADPNGNQRQKPDVGFLMELRFPGDLVTTGRISINRNWSLDLTWEP